MIIILTQCFPSDVGGIESLLSNLSLGLGKKFKVVVFADKYHSIHDSIYDNKYKKIIKVKRIGGIKFFRRRKKINELKLMLNKNKVELIISDTWKSLELSIDFINQKKISTLCLAHGNELLYNNKKKFVRISNTLNKVETIIANSKYTIDLLKNLKLKNNKIKKVYPGANDFKNIKEDKFIKISGSPVLITLARLEKRKGHQEILKSINLLKNKYPSIIYIIAGEGIEKQKLKKIVKEYQLEKNVIFTGLVNEPQKKYLFTNSDLMVMPTLDEGKKRSIEGFGISYIEAAFFGIPSIASNIGGTPEAVLNNKTGIIINNLSELHKSIDLLLSNNFLLKKLGNNAQIRALNHFNWEKVTQNYLKEANIL